MSGMLRMTFLTDFLKRLEKDGLLSEEDYKRMGSFGNHWINSEEPEPYIQINNALVSLGISDAQVSAHFKAAIGTTSALSYVQLGRPETIIFDTEERLEEQFSCWSLS